MVQLHVKRGDESQFLFNTTTDAPLESLIQQVTAIYNGRLKVDRICSGKTLSLLLPVLSVKDPHPNSSLLLLSVRAVLQLLWILCNKSTQSELLDGYRNVLQMEKVWHAFLFRTVLFQYKSSCSTKFVCLRTLVIKQHHESTEMYNRGGRSV